MDELITLGSLALGSEVLAFVLRRLRDQDIQQRLKRLALTFARALSLLFILGLLVSLMWASTISIYSALALTSGYTFSQVVLAFSLLFALASLFVHVFGYCFSGLLHRWPFGGRLWPKGIDYIYYVFGALALILIAANIFEKDALVASAIRAEIVGGIYLFNLKIFKNFV